MSAEPLPTPPRRIYISENEFAKLIRLSGDHGHLATQFGPSGVWLTRSLEGLVESAWVLKYLREWRGITVDQGAGI